MICHRYLLFQRDVKEGGKRLLVEVRTDDAKAADDGGRAFAHVRLTRHVIKVQPSAALARNDALGAQHVAVFFLVFKRRQRVGQRLLVEALGGFGTVADEYLVGVVMVMSVVVLVMAALTLVVMMAVVVVVMAALALVMVVFMAVVVVVVAALALVVVAVVVIVVAALALVMMMPVVVVVMAALALVVVVPVVVVVMAALALVMMMTVVVVVMAALALVMMLVVVVVVNMAANGAGFCVLQRLQLGL